MGLRGSECLSGASRLWVVGEAVGIQIGCTFTLWESPGGRSSCGSPLIMPASPPASAPTGCALGSAPRDLGFPQGSAPSPAAPRMLARRPLTSSLTLSLKESQFKEGLTDVQPS